MVFNDAQTLFQPMPTAERNLARPDAEFASGNPANVACPFWWRLSYHGQLHRDGLPPTEGALSVTVGWDAPRGMLCL